MRLLLDTHLLLWALAEPERLDPTTRAALEDPGNEMPFSAANLWEIGIKAGLGSPDFPLIRR
jgi:PIN domain nuclease of toxin-antitoxin system